MDEWCDKWLIKFNSKKSKCMIINKDKNNFKYRLVDNDDALTLQRVTEEKSLELQ